MEEMKLWEKEFGLDLPTEEEMEQMAKYFLEMNRNGIQ